MKIGIFGDSFADEFNMHRTDNMSWANQLRNLGYDVTNYGKCASSLYYSYRQLLEHHRKYDKVIFLITGAGRLYLDHLPEKLQHIAHGRVAFLKNETHGKNIEIINALEGYYNYLHNHTHENTIHNLLLKECKQIRPDALFIPCFPEHAENGFNLMMLSDYESEEFKNKHDLTNFRIIDRRFCHMNDNNNLLIAQKIKKWIDGEDFCVNESEFVPSTLPIEEILKLEAINV